MQSQSQMQILYYVILIALIILAAWLLSPRESFAVGANSASCAQAFNICFAADHSFCLSVNHNKYVELTQTVKGTGSQDWYMNAQNNLVLCSTDPALHGKVLTATDATQVGPANYLMVRDPDPTKSSLQEWEFKPVPNSHAGVLRLKSHHAMLVSAYNGIEPALGKDLSNVWMYTKVGLNGNHNQHWIMSPSPFLPIHGMLKGQTVGEVVDNIRTKVDNYLVEIKSKYGTMPMSEVQARVQHGLILAEDVMPKAIDEVLAAFQLGLSCPTCTINPISILTKKNGNCPPTAPSAHPMPSTALSVPPGAPSALSVPPGAPSAPPGAPSAPPGAPSAPSGAQSGGWCRYASCR
ncbi:MAG: hypothetical protein ACYCOU_03025 [Sulfobacillus sp.]